MAWPPAGPERALTKGRHQDEVADRTGYAAVPNFANDLEGEEPYTMVSRPVAVEVVPALLSKSLGPNVTGALPMNLEGSFDREIGPVFRRSFPANFSTNFPANFQPSSSTIAIVLDQLLFFAVTI